jgi:hypothetical protein
MVPPAVTSPSRVPHSRPKLERDLRAPLERFLLGRGFRVDFDVDGHDYFDAVARRGEELGLVELKLADWRKVHAQALVRRTWADWTAVLLPRRSLAERASLRPGPLASRAVGLWYLEEGEVRVLREARAAAGARGSPLREELREALAARDALRDGENVEILLSSPRARRLRRWDGRTWHLEEFEVLPEAVGTPSRGNEDRES